MRITCVLFFMLSLSATIQSQIPANAVALEDAAFNEVFAKRSIPSVTGKLLNIPAEELKNLTIGYTLVTPFTERQSRRTVSAQPDGSFRLELDYAFPYQQIWFEIGNLFYACLYANEDLVVELDMQKLRAAKKRVSFNGDGVRYLGTDGALNLYLNSYHLYKKPENLRLWRKISDLVNSRTMEADSILPEYNKLFDTLKNLEDNYIAANPSPYKWIVENDRMSEYYSEICGKYWGKTMPDTLWQKMKTHKSYLVSNSSTGLYKSMAGYIGALPGARVSVSWKDVALLPDLDAAEKALIDSLRDSEKMKPAYPYTTENIMKWAKQLLPRLQRIAFMRSLDKSIESIDRMFSPAKADFLKLQLNTSKDINDQKVALEHTLRSMHTSWCTVVLKKEYKHATDKIAEINKTLASSAGGTQHTSFGKPLMETPFGASMYKASGINVIDFLANLKQSFAGKAIIIDLWATWCGPCLAEFPHGKKLQEASTDLPVVFVYLCTINGSTESKWKSTVADLKQPGIHILIDEKLDADLASFFSFTGYPGHAFIDKTGKYRPGAIDMMWNIKDKEDLSALINR
jgi:thiol-disulfide isomerase/thioredoxin